MSHALALQSAPLAREVYALLRDMDPSRFRRKFANKLRERSSDLAERFAEMSAEGGLEHSLRSRCAELATVLREHVPAPSEDARRAWSGYRGRLQGAYAQLSQSLRANSVAVPAVRPTNVVRSLAHATFSTLIVLLLEYGLDERTRWLLPLVFAASFWAMEAARHFNERARTFLLWIFSSVAHPHERHRINSSTWLGTGLVILGLVFEAQYCVVGVAILGFADPIAALVGRRWGRHQLIHGRSLEGSIAFLIVGTLVAWAVLMIWHGHLGVGGAFVIAFAGGLFGAVAELVSGRRVDDNLSIPLAGAGGAWLASQLLSLA